MTPSLNASLLVSRCTPWPVLALVAVLSGCGASQPSAPDEGTPGDPCSPHGHVHRDAAGDWCHCVRGYMEQLSPLACVVDPNSSGEFSFGDEGQSACWRLDNTAHLTVAASAPGAPSVNRFDTVYLVEMPVSGDASSRTLTYDAAGTGDFILHLGRPVPLSVVEEGKGPLAVLGQKEASSCEGFQHMVGLSLAQGVRYSLILGPTSEPSVHLLIEQLP